MDGDVALSCYYHVHWDDVFPHPALVYSRRSFSTAGLRRIGKQLVSPSFMQSLVVVLQALGSRHSCSAALLPFTKMAGPPP